MYYHFQCNCTDYNLTEFMVLVCDRCGEPVADLRTKEEIRRDAEIIWCTQTP